MADASQAITSFLGGEISPYAQGRFDRPDYKFSLNVCLNSFPVEIGAWVRRPGTQYGSHSRGGNKGRTMEFDFEQSTPITMEFTDGWMRFRNGPLLLTTNDAQTVSAISTANPAVVNTTAANTWATGNTVMFPPGVPLLENRQITITQIDTTHFSLQDALTGANINGSTLGTIPAGLTVSRVQELQTVFGAGSWAVSSMRSVQAETTTILLNNSITPQAVMVAALPTLTANATFDIGAVTFQDGPYLDPFTNGVVVTPNSVSGIVTMTLSLPAYGSATAYPKGAFVTSSGSNYVSLQDQNVNNTPASSPTFWALTPVGAALNNGAGLSGTDTGRLVRFFSEPLLWNAATTYSAGQLVSYNPSGVPGAETYWSSLIGSNTGSVPGTVATTWSLVATNGAAVFTWGKITGLSNAISGSTGTLISTETMNNGSGAFNGNLQQNATAGAFLGSSGVQSANVTMTLSCFVGKNYSSGSQEIDHVVVYPSIDQGFGTGSYIGTFSPNGPSNPSIAVGFSFDPLFELNLRGSNSLPSSSSNGALLATTGTIPNTSAPITLFSNSQTPFEFVWVELVTIIETTLTVGPARPGTIDTGTLISNFSWSFFNAIGQITLFNPTGDTSGASFNVEILGGPLLYENVINTWQLGVYGGPNGFPTCGCYAEGRIWLGGAVSNRFDASVANGLVGTSLNFAPTDQFGVVSDSNGISETLNSDSVNPIDWMKPALEGVVMGTQNGEWLVQAPTTGSISPTNIAARRMTKHGSANIEPVRTPHAIVLIQRYARKLLEYFADAFSGKYSAPNLADKAAHITANGIAEIAYTEATTPIVWGYDTLGSLFGMTYKRDALMTSQPPDFYAWHRHKLGTGRIVESICSGGSVDGNLDALTMVTNDPITNIRHVEVLTDIPNETTPFLNSWFLDDAINPTSTSTTNVASTGFPYGGLTINGLWHLNNKTVQVFAGGLDCGDIGDLAKPFLPNFSYSQNQYTKGSDLNIYQSLVSKNIGRDPTTDGGVHWTLIGTGLDFVVSNGSITVPYGDGIAAGAGAGLFTATFAAALSLNQIVVGMTYNSDGQIVRPQTPVETGARTGPAFSKISRDHFLSAQLVNALGISFGTNFSSLTPARFTQEDEVTPIPSLTTFTDLYTDIPNAKHSRNNERLCWRISRPFPAAIAAIGASRATQDQ
jgi:hypothetical protein